MAKAELRAGTPRVLLVEDNPADVYLAQLLFERTATACELSVARDGEEALEALGLGGKQRKQPLPDLILLDLNLPKVDGWEVLRRIKTDPEAQSIPVVILSSARSTDEVNRCYELQANAFVRKVDEVKNMEEAMRSLALFWFQTVTLPPC
jgi:two-component system, chemotaxis family, response regulator Rcp1